MYDGTALVMSHVGFIEVHCVIGDKLDVMGGGVWFGVRRCGALSTMVEFALFISSY